MSVRFGVAVLVGLIGLGAAARAQDDPLAAYYGNTVHETRANGSQMWLMLKADHTFAAHGSDGRSMAGGYTFDAATRMNCLVLPPRPAGAPGGPPPGPPGAARPKPCAPLPGTKVGDSWDRKGPTGQNEHYVIEQGMTAPAGQ